MQDVPSLSTPELRLVLLSACGAWADDEIRALARGEVRWPIVTAIASWELATSVLSRRLDAVGADVPAELVADLRRTGMVEEFRMKTLEERARALVDAFNRAGIESVLLKGAGAGATSPDGFLARPMGDIDLLVPPDQAAEAHAVAKETGWVERGGGFEPWMYDDMHHLIPLVADDGTALGLEIHTDLFPSWSPFVFPVEEVRHRSVPPTRWEGTRVLTSEDQLLHACLHFSWFHVFRRGAWRMTRDANVLLADPELDREAFVSAAIEARGASAVYWTLHLIGELMGRPIGSDVLESLRATARPMLERLLLRHLSEEVLPRSGFPGTRTLRRFLWSLAIRPNAMGHGRVRPWSFDERWPDSRETLASQSGGPGLPDRFRGLLSYSLHVSGLT